MFLIQENGTKNNGFTVRALHSDAFATFLVLSTFFGHIVRFADIMFAG